jgi:curved DNA-binding protein CbpA
METVSEFVTTLSFKVDVGKQTIELFFKTPMRSITLKLGNPELIHRELGDAIKLIAAIKRTSESPEVVLKGKRFKAKGAGLCEHCGRALEDHYGALPDEARCTF